MIRCHTSFSTISLLLIAALIASTSPATYCRPASRQFTAVSHRHAGRRGRHQQHSPGGEPRSFRGSGRRQSQSAVGSLGNVLPAQRRSQRPVSQERQLGVTVFTDEKGVSQLALRPFQQPDRDHAGSRGGIALLAECDRHRHETNVASAFGCPSYVPAAGGSQMASRGHSKKTLIILLVVGPAGGAAYSLSRKSTPSATITVGNPTVGTPTVTGPK